MRVEDHQLAHSGLCDAAADRQPQPEQRFEVDAERAGKGRVFEAVADVQRRQHQHRGRGRQPAQRLRDHALVDQRIGGQRQMRPVLLDRRHRQQRDRARGVDAGEVGRRQFLPAAGRQRDRATGLHRQRGS
jgi:hypothetical protein